MIGNKKTVKLKKAKKKVKWKIVAGKKNISIKKKGKLKNKLIVKGKKLEHTSITNQMYKLFMEVDARFQKFP